MDASTGSLGGGVLQYPHHLLPTSEVEKTIVLKITPLLTSQLPTIHPAPYFLFGGAVPGIYASILGHITFRTFSK